MPEDPLEERVAAVERALCDADDPTADRTALRDRVADLEDDVADLEAAVQAVRGYVGGVRHVNDEVEQRADAAMAKARVVEQALATGHDGTVASPDAPAGAPVDETTPVDGGAPEASRREWGEHVAGDATRRADDVAATTDATGSCPRCGGQPRSEDAVGADSITETVADREPTGREGNRSTGPGDDRPTVDRPGARPEPGPGANGDDDRRVGERQVGQRQVGEGIRTGGDDSEEAGLLARVREVL